LILAGVTNTWNGVTINGGTLQIGNGGASGGLGAGTITDNSNLVFNLSGNLVVTNPITSGGNISQIGSGTVTLKADLNAVGFGGGSINITNGTLLIDGTSGLTTVNLNGGAFGGSGTVEGATITALGTTLFAGDPISSGTGTLTLAGGLNLGGNVLVKVNKSLAQKNDLFAVSDGLTVSGANTVNVENLGPALAVGDTFTIFNQAVTGGAAMAVTGGGAVWSNNLAVNGSIKVLSVTVPRPVITGSTLVGGTNLVFHGTNGTAGGPYSVLSSTNVATPLTNWTVVTSGSFDGSGNFTVTNVISNGVPRKFFILQQP
jgi:hypothetical protein